MPGSHGLAADAIVTKSGERIDTERRVPGEKKRTMDMRGHLDIVSTPLDRVGT